MRRNEATNDHLGAGILRREFLKLAGLGTLGITTTGCEAFLEQIVDTIRRRPVRRDINTLMSSDPILQAFRDAVRQMKALPSTDKRNWRNQARIHLDFCPHQNWLFLPWHRAYLYFFEEICRELSGMTDFALPYWNWSKDPRIPAALWGDDSNPLFHANRAASATSTAASSMVGPAVVGSILDETNFLLFASGAIPLTASQRTGAFYGRLEQTPHNYIHGFVGGDMGTFWSPLDPVFWTHHNMVECCWVEWNLVRNNPNTSDAAWTDRRFTEFVDRHGAAVNVSVLETLLYPLLAYRYDDPVKGRPQQPRIARLRRVAQPTSESEARRIESFLRDGADVQIEYLKRFPVREEVTVQLAQPATLAVPAPQAELRRTVAAARDDQRTMMTIQEVSTGHTEDFFVRVFLNKRDATPQTPLTDPQYAGSFAFFGHGAGHEAHHPTGNYMVDVTPVLGRTTVADDALDVTLVLVPFAGRTPKTRSMSLKGVELSITRDIVRRPA